MKEFTKKEFILFLLIFLLGAFLRVYRLDYPLGLHGDEAWTGIEAQRILKEGWIGIWSPSALGQVTLPFYWTAAVFKIFGDSVTTLRLSFALLNIVSLPFFYLTIRLLFKKEVALISFFLLAVSRIFIHFSHTAPTHALFPVPLFPALFFLLLTFRTRKNLYAILAGFFLGISQYFYIGLRMLPIFFIVFLIYCSLQKRSIRIGVNNLLIIVITGVVVSFPLLHLGFTNPELYWTRTGNVSIFSQQGLSHIQTSYYSQLDMTQIIFEQIKKTALMFHVKGDSDLQDNFTSLPLFDFTTGAFFILGFILTIKNIKRASFLFLLLWFIIFLINTIFTVDAPNFRRVQPSITASYVVAALGIIWLYNYLRKVFEFKYFINLLLILFLTFIAWSNIHLYFFKQAVSKQTRDTFSYPLVNTAEFLQNQPRPLYVYFYSNRWSYEYETLRFIAQDIAGKDRSTQFGEYSLENTRSNHNVVYLFFPEYSESFYSIQELYPNGRTVTQKDKDGSILFFAYIVNPSTSTVE